MNSSTSSAPLTMPTPNSGHAQHQKQQQNEVNVVPQRPSEQFFGKLKPLLSEKVWHPGRRRNSILGIANVLSVGSQC